MSKIAFAQKGSDALLKQIDELHQMYADYNRVDNVYDRSNGVQKAVYEALTNSVINMGGVEKGEASRLYVASEISEEAAFEISDLQVQAEELNKTPISPRLIRLKGIVNRIVKKTLKQYTYYREILRLHAMSLNPVPPVGISYSGNSGKQESIEEVAKRLTETFSVWEATNADLKILDEALIKEQDNLIQIYKSLAEEIKGLIRST